MNRLIKRLHLMGLVEEAKQLESLSAILDIDKLYNKNKNSINSIFNGNTHYSKYTIKYIASKEIYETVENPFKLIVGLKYNSRVYGIGIHFRDIPYQVRLLSDNNSKDKIARCVIALEKIVKDSNLKNIDVGNMSKKDIETYIKMTKFIVTTSLGYSEEDVKEMYKMLDRNPQLISIAESEVIKK